MNLDKVKEFLRLSEMKIILFLLIIGLAISLFNSLTLWGHSISPFPNLLFFPILLFVNSNSLGFALVSLTIALLYSYLLACLITLFFQRIKTKKWLVVISITLIILLLGFDEPVINNTINKPDYSCSYDSDCEHTLIAKGGCGSYACVNSEWDYYDSLMNSVFALSCARPLVECSCEQAKCISNYINTS